MFLKDFMFGGKIVNWKQKIFHGELLSLKDNVESATLFFEFPPEEAAFARQFAIKDDSNAY